MSDLVAVGLILNMIGVVMLFFFGVPAGSQDEYARSGRGEERARASARDYDARPRRLARRRVLARTGLALMFLGFLVQLVATG